MKNTIVLRGKGIKSEFLCKEELMPGMLVELTTDSGLIKLQKNSNEDNLQETCFVTEYEAFGKTILDKCSADETAQVYFASPGDVIYARVDADVELGNRLVSDGTGLLKAVDEENDFSFDTNITIEEADEHDTVTGTVDGTTCTIQTADIVAALQATANISDKSINVVGYGIKAIALEDAEKVSLDEETDIYFARVIIL